MWNRTHETLQAFPKLPPKEVMSAKSPQPDQTSLTADQETRKRVTDNLAEGSRMLHWMELEDLLATDKMGKHDSFLFSPFSVNTSPGLV